ncbi:anti-sigma regulatory factor [Actinomycetes bacterium NPDC127524]
MNKKITVEINDERDIVLARKTGRELSASYHYNAVDQARIVTAISELARNIYRYAGTGLFTFEEVIRNSKFGLKITAIDKGPGIKDIREALQTGFSTSGGLGAGLGGVKKLMDEFKIESESNGTIITTIKWFNG